MDLINKVTGVDEEGRSRQRILLYAAKKYVLFSICHFLSFQWILNFANMVRFSLVFYLFNISTVVVIVNLLYSFSSLLT